MKSNDFDKETTTKAGETTESYMTNNFQDIETVEIEKVYRDPMGGMSIDGTVNEQYEFSLGMDEDDYTVQSGGYGEGFPDFKKECEDTVCDY
ncbi:MAG TPA: hypothetical protein VK105_18005 [Virgibacillus sp.]|nr:hypothetical protein [Virgibacillus sp.]HLR68982.1 hypothetical protein [Virgibacillus sp.]